MKAIILAAGVGSRLGKPFPRCLSRLPYGEMILGRQIRILRECGINEIIVVVGFKKEFIMEYFPGVLYKYNPLFYITNTAKSLLCAVEDLDDDILWMNGDVVFDKQVLKLLVKNKGNAVADNSAHCGEEEVKYRADKNGFLLEISKQVANPQGEAVGINRVSREDLISFKKALQEAADEDYFEKGIELMLERGKRFKVVNISEYRCIEVDFPADWEVAVSLFSEPPAAATEESNEQNE